MKGDIYDTTQLWLYKHSIYVSQVKKSISIRITKIHYTYLFLSIIGKSKKSKKIQKVIVPKVVEEEDEEEIQEEEVEEIEEMIEEEEETVKVRKIECGVEYLWIDVHIFP